MKQYIKPIINITKVQYFDILRVSGDNIDDWGIGEMPIE